MARCGRNHPQPDHPHEGDNTLGDHLYRVDRHGPGAQQVSREPANLDELRHALRSLLEGPEPGTFRPQSNAVTITGTREGEEVTVTVQYFVAQPTDTWAPAGGGPITHSSAWSDTAAQEAHQRGWHVAGPQPGDRRRLGALHGS